MKTRSAGLAVIALIAAMTPSAAQTYNIVDLGAVPGQSVSGGYGLNYLGQACGVSSSPSGDIATLFSNGSAINLGTLEAGDVSIATAINGSTEIVGYEPFALQAGDLSHAWIWINGKLTDIQSSTLFPQGTRAAGVNSTGVVVGQGNLTSSSFHAFLYSNGQMVDIGPPGSYQAAAVAINDSGQVIGHAYFSTGGGGAFVYQSGTFTYLPPPPGATVGAFAINNLGEVAGAIYPSGGGTHVALYANGSWTDYGGVTGAAAHATGLNIGGQVVATAIYPTTSYHPFKPGKHVAYIVSNGVLVDLNTLVPTNSGYTLTDAIAINDAGEILCNSTNVNGTKHAVLLTPK